MGEDSVNQGKRGVREGKTPLVRIPKSALRSPFSLLEVEPYAFLLFLFR